MVDSGTRQTAAAAEKASRVFFFPPSFQSPRRSPADPRPDATQTLPLSSFSPAQLRKGTSACDPCCSSRAARGTDHDATALWKSAKEVRAERKEKRKREEEEAKRNKKKDAAAAASSDAAATTATLTEVKSSAIDFGAVARFDPDAASSSDSESARPTRDDETKGDDDEKRKKRINDASVQEPRTHPRLTSTEDQKAAEAQLRKRQVYLGGVPFHKTEDEIRAAFEEENLPVENVDCMTFPDSGRFRGIAILTFATREAAKGALAWNGEEWDGTFLTVKKYAPKERREERADGGDDDGVPTFRKNRLALGEVSKTEGQRLAFVCNLSWDVTEETLRAALTGCEVADVRMGVDKETGHFRGFAHVELATDQDLERAVALNGASVLGRPMKIAYATARKSARDGDSATVRVNSRGGRGGRGGGGGRVAKKE